MEKRHTSGKSTLCILAALAASCTGDISDVGATPEGVDEVDTRPTGEEEPALPAFAFEPEGSDVRPGIRRLTRGELAHVYRELTGLQPDRDALPADVETLNLHNDASRLRIDDALTLQTLMREATRLAAEADLSATFACVECNRAELSQVLERVLGRPADAPLVDAYEAAYAEVREEHGDEMGRRAMLQMLLVEPGLLYRFELGEEGRLTPHQLATKLAFTLTGAPPDDALWTSVLDGSLGDDDVYVAHVDRLLAGEAVVEYVQRFIFDWLGLDDVDLSILDGSADIPPTIARSMEEEVRRLIRDEFFERDDGSVVGLIQRNTTFVDEDLATLYGLDVVVPAGEFMEVSLDGTQRRGVLTTALTLAAHAKEAGRSPMQRGAFMVGELLCTNFPVDAGTAAMTLPAGTTDLSFREKFEALEVRSDCGGCHRMLNAGFAFDIFDNVGRRWSEDTVPAVAARGTFAMPPYETFEFQTTLEAIDGLGDHPALGRCFTAQLWRFVQGSVPSAEDVPALESLEADFRDHGGHPLAALRAIVLDSRFTATRMGAGSNE